MAGLQNSKFKKQKIDFIFESRSWKDMEDPVQVSFFARALKTDQNFLLALFCYSRMNLSCKMFLKNKMIVIEMMMLGHKPFGFHEYFVQG